MEADTKNKRGRPSVYKGIESYKTHIKCTYPEYGERAVTNMFYVLEGLSFSQKVYGEVESKKIFFNSRDSMIKKGIAEQIGRMIIQNNFDEASCKSILQQALDYLEKGYTVKEVEKYIRTIRNAASDL